MSFSEISPDPREVFPKNRFLLFSTTDFSGALRATGSGDFSGISLSADILGTGPGGEISGRKVHCHAGSMQRGVRVHFIGEKMPPRMLGMLAEEGLISIAVAKDRLPFSGRIIDESIVHRFDPRRIDGFIRSRLPVEGQLLASLLWSKAL
jgi:hypothetical protein